MTNEKTNILEPVALKNLQGDILNVYHLGAKITVVLNAITVLGSFTRGDGKQAMTHPCTPVFGPDRKNLYGLKQHGNMRNEECEVKHIAESVMVSHKVTDPGYPAGIIVKQFMSVEDNTFSLVMIHTNIGTESASVNGGEHCYFDAPKGYAGTTINGQDISTLIEDNENGIAFTLHETNLINIPGKPEVTLTQNGFSKAMLWVGKNPESKEIDTKYICIEPVEADPNSDYFGSPKSMISPGSSRSAMFSLKLSDQLQK